MNINGYMIEIADTDNSKDNNCDKTDKREGCLIFK